MSEIVTLKNHVEAENIHNKNQEDIPVYSVTHDKGFCVNYFSKDVSGENKSTYKIVPRGYFAYNPLRVNVGSLGYQDVMDRVQISSRYVVFKLTSDAFYPRYLVYLLKSRPYLRIIREKCRGTVRPELTIHILKTIPVELRSIEEQKQIVARLDAVKERISETEKLINRFDELVKSRFIEMFGDLQTQPIALNKVCTFINGDRGVNYPSKEDFVESGVPFVNAGHLINGVIDFSEMNYITQDKYDKLGSGKIERGDILYCLRGSIGKQAISTITHAAIASSLVILRPSKDILPEYLSYELGSVRAQKYLAQCKNGSSQPNLSADSLKKYPLRIPSIEQQQSFVEFVKQADKSKYVTCMAKCWN